MEGTTGRDTWTRWVLWTTTAEVTGFTAPAVVGVATREREGLALLLPLVAAGLVEGSVLGAGQGHVLRDVLPGLRLRRFVVATALAAGAAYAVAMLPAAWPDTVSSLPAPLLVLLAAAGGVVMLASIGTGQWLVLREVLPRSASWVLTTALAWLAGLGVFLGVATPWWHVGQSALVAVLIGLVAATLMALTVAVVTGAALVRLLARDREPAQAR
ncbi:hypothetical protein [Nocardioides sediminis]|uniref:hypothetical protein n=1 Tax=Nocardioides sediminis TaxID=433648 RepID=UPI000D323A59|nr:hypothetical protein [Nocardioides sediminis]